MRWPTRSSLLRIAAMSLCVAALACATIGATGETNSQALCMVLAAKNGESAPDDIAHEIRLLIARGANPDARCQGTAALIVAAQDPRYWRPKVTALLESGANANAINQFGGTLLFRDGDWTGQVGGDYIALVDLLISHGADPNFERTSDGATPLLSMSFDGAGHANVIVAEHLIAAGADVNTWDYAQRSPLTIALLGPGRVEMVRMLLEHGADPNLIGLWGTALDVARMAQQTYSGPVDPAAPPLQPAGDRTAAAIDYPIYFELLAAHGARSARD